MEDQDYERLITVTEVCMRFRISNYTVRRYIKAGKLRGYRTGERGTWKIPLEDCTRVFLGQKAA